MSTVPPTTAEISANIVAQLEAKLNQQFSLLPRGFVRVLAQALAGVFVLLYKYAGFGILQYFVRTASTQETEINGRTIIPLVELGIQFGVGEPASATPAELLIDIAVTNQVGNLDGGAQLVNANTGVTYITIGTVALDAAIVQATVRAVADQSGGDGSGEIGNMQIGQILSFANALPNVEQDATVAAQLITGADGESWDAYRQRVLNTLQNPPQGGALADYVIWATEPAGVLNAYPYRSDCPGQVDVYIVSATEPDGIPTQAQLQEALDAINFNQNGLATRRPVGALPNTFSIINVTADVEVVGLIVNDEAQVKLDIEASITQYLAAREPYIQGVTVPPITQSVSNGAIGGRVDVVVSAAGGLFENTNMFINGAPLNAYNLGIGQKVILGTITYI